MSSDSSGKGATESPVWRVFLATSFGVEGAEGAEIEADKGPAAGLFFAAALPTGAEALAAGAEGAPRAEEAAAPAWASLSFRSFVAFSSSLTRWPAA